MLFESHCLSYTVIDDVIWKLQTEAGPIVRSYYEAASVEVGHEYQVLLSHVDSPGQIWCQQDAHHLEQLMQDMMGKNACTSDISFISCGIELVMNQALIDCTPHLVSL